MSLDNRDAATLIWIFVVAVVIVAVPRTRRALAPVLRAAARWKIVVPIVALIAYISGLTILGWKVGLWNQELLLGTVFWFFSGALAVLMDLKKALSERHYFRRLALRALEVTTALQALMSFFVLGLWLELLLLAVVVLLAMLSAAAGATPEHRRLKPVFDSVLAILVLAGIGYNIALLIVRWQDLDHAQLVREVALPIWMTLGFLPFMYVFTVVAAFELPFDRVDLVRAPWWPRLRTKLAIAASFRGRTDEIAGLRQYWIQRAVKAADCRSAIAVIDEYRAGIEKRQRESEVAAFRLKAYAGVSGQYTDGRRLDQREFVETREVLRYLASCQMGWYNNRGGIYRQEILAFIKGHNDGLPDDPDVTMYVAEDGQAWWAWRRTISGWCFAIGAVGPPPDQWLFDGPGPPQGPPGRDDLWVPTLRGTPPNW